MARRSGNCRQAVKVTKLLRCQRCGWTWLQVGGKAPVGCAKCHTTLWNTPRERNVKRKYRAKQHERIVDLTGLLD